MIGEPTLEQYTYYLRRLEEDTPRTIQEKRHCFEQEFRALLGHLERLSGQALPAWNWPEESHDDFLSQLIWTTGWIHGAAGNGRAYFASAYIYHDVYCLQAGCCQSGQAGPEIFADLRLEAWKPGAEEHLLGSSTYLCGIASDGADELTARAFAAFTGESPDRVLAFRLEDFDSRLYGLPGRLFLGALFYPDAGREALAGEEVLNHRLPRLELYRHKVDRQLGWCEGNAALLSEQGRELTGLLDAFEGASFPADSPQARDLAWLYQLYDGNVRMVDDRMTTIGTNLRNLDIVLDEFGERKEGDLLHAVQEGLWGRRKELSAFLGQAARVRDRGAEAVETLIDRLGLDGIAGLLEERGDVARGAGVLPAAGFPGTASPYDPAALYPELEIKDPARIVLDGRDRSILQHVYQGAAKLRVLKRFTSGFACRHVLLVQPINEDGRQTALRVVKIASAPELLIERNNYCNYVENLVYNSAAVQEWQRYYAEGELAGLGYKFVGGGGLGETIELDEYYARAALAGTGIHVRATLDRLLTKELGEWWYRQADDRPERTFEAEYGPDMFEHLRIRLRPDSGDALWPAGQPPAEAGGYAPVRAADLPAAHRDLKPGDRLQLEGLVVSKVKGGIAKLQDAGDMGIVVRFELGGTPPPAAGETVGLRGEVVYNRHGRMAQVVGEIFPELAGRLDDDVIALPGVPGTFPNPLARYPALLGRRVGHFRESYVHGDLHMHNVLVDEVGFGRLIDFAEVGLRHNLFDFIKLETYIRYLRLSRIEPAMPWDDYVRFEDSLAAGSSAAEADLPRHPQLRFAREIILEVRRIAGQFMVNEADLRTVYLPALFLYCLALTRYYQPASRYGTQLAFVTACVTARHLR